MFDATDRETFAKLTHYAELVKRVEPTCRLAVVVGKTDLLSESGGKLTRTVSKEEVQAFASSVGAVVYVETSAKVQRGRGNLAQGGGGKHDSYLYVCVRVPSFLLDGIRSGRGV